MACNSCGSNQEKQFASELCIHFPGVENLSKPHVLEFPNIVVCLECGYASFRVSQTDLRLLQDNTSNTRDITHHGLPQGA
jgi:hypothetical protein